jgi:transposase
MAEVTIELDTPEDVEICGYERHEDGHAFEVRWPWPEQCRCERCGQEEAARIALKGAVYVVRDLELWGQPSFWVYRPPVHACSRCGRRQHVAPPFKRKDVGYTYRFEEAVLRSLIGSTEEDVARRWGISAETVALIVQNQLGEVGAVDPQRKITEVGLDEISLKNRHKQYVTILMDLSASERPQVLGHGVSPDFCDLRPLEGRHPGLLRRPQDQRRGGRREYQSSSDHAASLWLEDRCRRLDSLATGCELRIPSHAPYRAALARLKPKQPS